MLSAIPTHLIAGPLGAGKTSLLRALLAQKPAGERWAILINEFGLVGLDAALLSGTADDVSFAEVAGGCLCCVNGVPFQVGLNRLLRKARPDRLFIEPSGLGHPHELLGQLAGQPWHEVLALQPCVLVLDAAALAGGHGLPAYPEALLVRTGLLVLNKCEHLTEPRRALLADRLPALPIAWVRHGELALERLPGIACRAVERSPSLPAVGAGPLPLASLWLDLAQPICQHQVQDEGWSIGWRWHPSQRFDLARVQGWLAGLGWRRAKLVMRGHDHWQSANALEGEALHWRATEWRKDSRLELIFARPQDVAALERELAGCRIVAAGP
ncbi:CobW family GTP-binding protein [Stutzerimonas kirkiae]|uniref:Cobalamin biosynthesis protein CobW n=1 Tax=Stutzerimonas kirkiae TaxID=2211392 RepID=A0A4Q9REC5_9GAMM|nr:CobW-like GTP-binding protein [Stutzerimonas kirkiae]TBU99159.1 cobalamin biosynthesis protein CobW [Stutzerimonas kirkiae]TBV06381.1 cobalamin biosynthesis protein CobW [Stutzerimonas kirkiae]TBV07487.1 cobalamin biosynthesis protein CobW [Stutzerimonas kirkiae]TBV15728.1 cobalamin biosynthesis protein CobW [Stutzerimonas kirkiae]